MTTTAELKKQLSEALSLVVDEPMTRAGFLRRKNALVYSKKLPEAVQQISIGMDSFPRYRPGADAHILPKLRLQLPAVSAEALALVGGDKWALADAPELIVNQPIEFTAPKEEQPEWYATGSQGFLEVCTSIQEFLARWTLPFLAEAQTAADLIRIYESGDGRMMRLQHWHVFVAAAYRLHGKVEQAREVANRHLGSPGLRKQYAALFAALG